MDKKLALLLLLSIFLCCFGCGVQQAAEQNGGSAPTIDIGAFQAEDEDFKHPNLDWGISPAQAEQALGISFANANRTIDTDLRDGDQGYYRLVYVFNDVMQGHDYPIGVSYEFLDEKLCAIAYFFDAPAQEADFLYETIRDDLIELYGAPYEKPGVKYDTGTVWRKTNTVLNVLNNKPLRPETGRGDQVIVAVYHTGYGMPDPPQDD